MLNLILQRQYCLRKAVFLLLAAGQAWTDNSNNYFFLSYNFNWWWFVGGVDLVGGVGVPMPLQVRGGTVVHFESLPPLVLVVRPFWARHMLTCVKNYTSPKLSPSAPASHWLLAAAAAPENE